MDDNARAQDQATIARLEKDIADLRTANRAAMAEILDLHRLLRMQGWRATRLQGLGPLGALVLKVVK
jgi:hypothetical protein